MIKPIEITPLRTTNKLYYRCENCGLEGEIILVNGIANIDESGKIIEPQFKDFECQKCNKIIKE
jgi:transcription elongation factor Elf1